jgi:Coenzyme PQQ synthesis protein D (PqqD)
MTAINSATLFRCNPAVIQTEIEGQIVLLHPGDWDYFEFNDSATALWRLLGAPRTFAAIVAALAQEFDVDPDRCAADTAPLLQEMVKKALVMEG